MKANQGQAKQSEIEKTTRKSTSVNKTAKPLQKLNSKSKTRYTASVAKTAKPTQKLKPQETTKKPSYAERLAAYNSNNGIESTYSGLTRLTADTETKNIRSSIRKTMRATMHVPHDETTRRSTFRRSTFMKRKPVIRAKLGQDKYESILKRNATRVISEDVELQTATKHL